MEKLLFDSMKPKISKDSFPDMDPTVRDHILNKFFRAPLSGEKAVEDFIEKEISVQDKAPYIEGKFVNLRPIEIESKNDVIFLVERRMELAGDINGDFTRLYKNNENNSCPELASSNQHIKVIVELQSSSGNIKNKVIRFGTLISYLYDENNLKTGLEECFEKPKKTSTQEEIQIIKGRKEARALFVKYLVEKYELRTIFSNYYSNEAKHKYFCRELSAMGMIHKDPTMFARRINNEWLNEYPHVFQHFNYGAHRINGLHVLNNYLKEIRK